MKKGLIGIMLVSLLSVGGYSSATTVQASQTHKRSIAKKQVVKRYGNLLTLPKKVQKQIKFTFRINQHIKYSKKNSDYLIGTDMRVKNQSARTISFNTDHFDYHGSNRMIVVKPHQTKIVRNALQGTRGGFTIPVETVASAPSRTYHFVYRHAGKYKQVKVATIDSLFVPSQRGSASYGIRFGHHHGRRYVKYVLRTFK